MLRDTYRTDLRSSVTNINAKRHLITVDCNLLYPLSKYM